MIRKQTKIVATISDRNCSTALIRKLYKHGMDAVRLNTAHQTPETSLKIIKNVRKVNDSIPIILDTKGPEVRARKCPHNYLLKKGEIIRLKYGSFSSFADKKNLYVSYKRFVKEVPIGAVILIADGDFELKVVSKRKDYLNCKIITGGRLRSNKGINIPGVSLRLPALTPNDKKYIQFAIKNDIDFIAHSFVRNEKDVKAVQKILDAHKSKIKIIAKIENHEGVENIDRILPHVYGIMVARGDLGMEIPFEQVPVIQKQIIRKCIESGKPVITATQMLVSMIDHPRPTRAEVSDIANAIYDGTDAVMLSGETAYGSHPVAAIAVMFRVARHVERNKKGYTGNPDLKWNNQIHKFLGEQAIQASVALPIKSIVISTKTGATARLVATYRGNLPILAKAMSMRVVRELAIVYGVYPSYIKKMRNTDELICESLLSLLNKGFLTRRDLVVILGSTPGAAVGTDFIEIKTIAQSLKKFKSKR